MLSYSNIIVVNNAGYHQSTNSYVMIFAGEFERMIKTK